MDLSTTESALRSLTRRETVTTECRLLAKGLLDNAAFQVPKRDVEAAVRCFLNSEGWECIAVGMLLAQEITHNAVVLSTVFAQYLFHQADSLLEHGEPRVRHLVASVLGSLANRNELGLAVYSHFKTRLSEIIETNFERGTSTQMYQISDTKQIPADDTTGWKVLQLL